MHRAAELFDSHDSLISSTPHREPTGVWKEHGLHSTFDEWFTTCHAYALARNSFVSVHHSFYHNPHRDSLRLEEPTQSCSIPFS